VGRPGLEDAALDSEPERVSPGHEARAGGGAEGVHVELLESRTAFRESVDVGRGDHAAVVPDVVPPEIVGHDEDNVGGTGPVGGFGPADARRSELQCGENRDHPQDADTVGSGGWERGRRGSARRGTRGTQKGAQAEEDERQGHGLNRVIEGVVVEVPGVERDSEPLNDGRHEHQREAERAESRGARGLGKGSVREQGEEAQHGR